MNPITAILHNTKLIKTTKVMLVTDDGVRPRHQHELTPTSVSNIRVASQNSDYIKLTMSRVYLASYTSMVGSNLVLSLILTIRIWILLQNTDFYSVFDCIFHTIPRQRITCVKNFLEKTPVLTIWIVILED